MSPEEENVELRATLQAKLEAEGTLFCPVHENTALCWSTLDVKLEGKPTKHASLGLCPLCEKERRENQ